MEETFYAHVLSSPSFVYLFVFISLDKGNLFYHFIISFETLR